MDTIKTIKCHLCEKNIKVGFIAEQGSVITNHPLYEMYLIHRDLSKAYFEEYKGSDGIKLMTVSTICEECFEKLLNKKLIKENEELLKEKYQLTHDLYEAYIKINKMTEKENENEELKKENYNLIREINELNGDMDQLM